MQGDVLGMFIQRTLDEEGTRVVLYETDGRRRDMLYSYSPSKDKNIAVSELVLALKEYPSADWVVSRDIGGDYVTSVTLPGNSQVGQWDRVARIIGQALYDPDTPARIRKLIEAVTTGIAAGIENGRIKAHGQETLPAQVRQPETEGVSGGPVKEG